MFRSFSSVILFECYTQAIDEVICRPCLPLTMDVVVLSASGITAPSIQSKIKTLLHLSGDWHYESKVSLSKNTTQ